MNTEYVKYIKSVDRKWPVVMLSCFDDLDGNKKGN